MAPKDHVGKDTQCLIACPDCDLLQWGLHLKIGIVKCVRCGATLYHRKKNSLEHTLALSLGGLFLFVTANIFPLLDFEFEGQMTQATLFSGIRDLYNDDMWALAGLVLLTSIAFPLTELVALLYLLVPLHFNRVIWNLTFAFRILRIIQPWSMMEVFLLGILVAIVKLSDMATIIPGIALWSFSALIIVLAAANASFDSDAIWEKIQELELG